MSKPEVDYDALRKKLVNAVMVFQNRESGIIAKIPTLQDDEYQTSQITGRNTAITAFMATVQALATVDNLLEERAARQRIDESQAVRLPQGVLDLKKNK
jgi:hypothetical protein